METREIASHYESIEGERLFLGNLLEVEKAFLKEVSSMRNSGVNYLNLENFLMESNDIFLEHSHRVGKEVENTILYKVCEDIAKRLGVRQGFLKKEDVTRKINQEIRIELTTGNVAELAHCSSEAVRKAIRTGRLPARRVNRLSLIWKEDAMRFAELLKKKKLRSPSEENVFEAN